MCVHLKNGQAVECPFEDCGRKYSVLKLFISHLSRCHKIPNERAEYRFSADFEGQDDGMEHISDN